MKNSLASVYEKVLLNEAEKFNLQNPSADEVGSIKAKQDLFSSKPKPVEGPDKAKLKQGPSYEVTTGSSSAPKVQKASAGAAADKSAAPAKEPKTESPKEMKDTKVDPTNEEENEESSEKKESKKEANEGLALTAFEALFKKTLSEEFADEMTTQEAAPATEDVETTETEENYEDDTNETETESEGDLISDLKELHSKLADILAKLEDATEEGENSEDEEYTDEDFEEEFGEDETEKETEVKEAVEKPKALSDAHGKKLLNKNNKVGRLSPKGGKAHTGDADDDPKPKPLGDKKGALLKKKAEVSSTVKKGDFFK